VAQFTQVWHAQTPTKISKLRSRTKLCCPSSYPRI